MCPLEGLQVNFQTTQNQQNQPSLLATDFEKEEVRECAFHENSKLPHVFFLDLH